MTATETASPTPAAVVTRQARLPRMRRRAHLVTTALAHGLAGGVVVGAAYRGWMRLIATEPSFSWEGTIGIVVAMTIATTSAAIVAAVRSHAKRRWVRGLARWVTSALILLVLSSPPATATLPAFLAGALAWGRRDWPRRWRRALGAAAGVLTVASLLFLVDLAALPTFRAVWASAGYVLLILLSSWLLAIPTGACRSDDALSYPDH